MLWRMTPNFSYVGSFRVVLYGLLVSFFRCVMLQATDWNPGGHLGTRMEIHGRYKNYTWPHRDLASVVAGDVVLGALHMIHARSEDKVCGRIMAQGGIQALETMLYTLDYINSNESDILPGIRLGMLTKDDCDRDIYGLEQAVDFIRGSIANIGGSSYKCKDGSNPENDVRIISGVIAAPSSVTSIQVANLLKLFRIPQVSFFSTSPVLSNRERFPYFLRTIPSDVNQAQAMVELVKMLKWTYVSVVYEESSYGMQGFNEVEKLLKENGICLATTEKLLKDSGVASGEAYDTIVDRLLQKVNARGVIIFGSDQEVGELMEAVNRKKATGTFAWIGSDGWGGRGLAFRGKEDQVEGAITVQPLASEVEGFREYFRNLRPQTNLRNPWFIEYWEEYFKCKYPGSAWTPFNENYTKVCTGNEEVTEENGFELEGQLQFVSDAVMSFAYAVKGVQEQVCGGGYEGICPAMENIDGDLLKKHLLNVSFTGLSGQHFQFLSNGDGPSRYRILNFRRNDAGHFEWATVGYFRGGNLTITSPLQFRVEEPSHPESVCNKPCAFYEARLPFEGDPCCWMCSPCNKYQYLPTKDACVECPWGTLPSWLKDECIEIPPRYLQYHDGIAIAAMTFASLGVIGTSLVALVFFIYRDTPVVKASGRELSFVLLGGILFCYAITFVLVSKPMTYTCGTQKIGMGLCFSVCYSAILTKTNRISRIFRAGKRTVKRPKFISPESQLVICGSLVCVQILIGLVWLLISPPKSIPYYSNRDDHQLVCEGAVGYTYMIGFSYPILLVTVCTFYALFTRKIPEAFNESKYIGFTMYTTCIIWLAFVVIYFTTASNIQMRLATMCFSISLSATVALVCMFTPKLYIILLHPERNVRQSMMAKAAFTKPNNASALRVDSGTQSDVGFSEVEMTQRLKSSGSFSSAFSRSTSATQTYSNGNSISTQTLDSMEQVFDDEDVQL
ncbi:metabotropic glutamate receptor 8-like [Haliotis asinina]|uniref:metabotropic glutamate receptor 8-like n=1 Tax=Haliotis asinina TaxID=109174 RepID=UPI003531F3B9